MVKGRPLGSEIRQAIVEILNYLDAGTGYSIYKIYKEIFPAATMRSIYYHLKKGLQTKEFEIADVKIESGDFSWGQQVQKTYYKLGPSARPNDDARVKKYLKK